MKSNPTAASSNIQFKVLAIDYLLRLLSQTTGKRSRRITNDRYQPWTPAIDICII